MVNMNFKYNLMDGLFLALNKKKGWVKYGNKKLVDLLGV
jgi:hypothetical protein